LRDCFVPAPAASIAPEKLELVLPGVAGSAPPPVETAVPVEVLPGFAEVAVGVTLGAADT
jgi:hypothetical protein